MMTMVKQILEPHKKKRFAIAIVFSMSMVTGSAYGFGMLNNHGVLSQNAEHEQITRAALDQFNIGSETLDLIAGKTGGAGAIGAPDVYMPLKRRAHCDGGDYMELEDYPYTRKKANKRLRKCRDWVFDNLDKAVKRAGKLVDKDGNIKQPRNPKELKCVFNGIRGRAKCNVIEKMGYAMHASQDFYSHSNWVDIANPEMPVAVNNPPGLANKVPSLWMNPRNRSEPVPSGLMSGCFSLNPIGCNDRVGHSDLNKDTGLSKIELSPLRIDKGSTERGKHEQNFERAVNVAIADTADKWMYFEEQVKIRYPGARGEAIVCAVRNDDPAVCR